MMTDTSLLKWNTDLATHDMQAILGGGVCIAVGGVVALLIKEPWILALGAAAAAGIIGLNIVEHHYKPIVLQKAAVKKPVRSGGCGSSCSMVQLGAPRIEPEEPTRAVGNAGAVRADEVDEYPKVMPHVPEAAFRTDDTQDARYKWHNTGPKGPYVGDRSIYGFQ